MPQFGPCIAQKAPRIQPFSREGTPCGRCGQSQGLIWKQGVEFNPYNGAGLQAKQLTCASSPCCAAMVDGDFEKSHVIEQCDAFSVGYSTVLPVDAVDIHSGGTQWNLERAFFAHLFEGALVDVGDQVAKGVHVQDAVALLLDILS